LTRHWAARKAFAGASVWRGIYWEGDMRFLGLGLGLVVSLAIAVPASAGPLNLPGVLAAPPIVETVQYLPKSGFHNPMANGAPVDWCSTYATNCGAGGAALFCQQHGFGSALSWKTFSPGRTFVIGSNEFCNGSFCTGFSFVRCGGPGGGAPAAGAPAAGTTVVVAPIFAPPAPGLTPGTTPPTGGSGGPFLPKSGFHNPTSNGAAVDWCVTFATNCGGPGATQFCQRQGFANAISWKTFHPGRTFVLGDSRFCNGSVCTGFSFVRCG
jgi:hypothetical protein